MAPRIARSSLPSAVPKSAKNKSKKRTQDAYAIASHATASNVKSRSTRLGVVEDEGPKQKRRRTEDESDEDEEEDERSGGKSRKRARNGGDEVEHGSDSEGNEWVAGGLASGDSDSDLDSDEAFGESDEEKFAGFAFRGGSGGAKPKAKKKVASGRDDVGFDLGDEDEDEEDEEESDFGDEGVDLATMLDDNVDEALGSKDTTERDMDGESASEGSDEASDMDEEEDFTDFSADDADTEEDEDERHARLQDFVEALDKKAPQDKARIVGDEDGGLTVEDLLEDADLDKATLATFKPKRKSKAPQTLTAPLPKRQQDKIDREIATEKAKQQLDRWRDTVIQNRRAEFLQFPLKNADEAEPIGKDVFVPSQFEKPRTELEQNIQKIMEESGMVSKGASTQAAEDAEQGILKAEELATNKLPIEEVLARRAHLRRARELLFREEVKAKRIAKIKSRSYRRVHRKERERQAQKDRLDENGEEIPMDEDEKEVADRKRAAARMGTKHRDSKWAKSLKATDRAVWDESAKEGAVEQARRQEELRKRVVGKDLSDEGDSDVSDDDADDDEGITFRQIDKLGNVDSAAPEKGIGAMKFMRAADERRKAANDEAIAQFKRDLNGDQSDQEEDDSIGRAIFGPASNAAKTPAPKAVRLELEEGDASDDEVRQTDDEEPPPANTTQKRPRSILKKPTVESSVVSQGVKDRRQRSNVKPAAIQETSAWLDAPEPTPSAWVTEKSKAKSGKPSQDDPSIINSVVLATSKEAMTGLDAIPSAPTASDSNNNGDEMDFDTDAEQPAAMLSSSALKKSLLQRGFAGDDVAAAFAAEKAALTQAEEEKEVSTALPGWGTWTGAALSKHNRRAAAKQRHNPLYKTKLPGGVSAELRKDRSKDNVIVSEKTERKGKVYLAPILPHEFERKEEYERSLRLPIGAEWGTKEVVQRNVKPRVVVRPGRVVEAIERPRV